MNSVIIKIVTYVTLKVENKFKQTEGPVHVNSELSGDSRRLPTLQTRILNMPKHVLNRWPPHTGRGHTVWCYLPNLRYCLTSKLRTHSLQRSMAASQAR